MQCRSAHEKEQNGKTAPLFNKQMKATPTPSSLKVCIWKPKSFPPGQASRRVCSLAPAHLCLCPAGGGEQSLALRRQRRHHLTVIVFYLLLTCYHGINVSTYNFINIFTYLRGTLRLFDSYVHFLMIVWGTKLSSLYSANVKILSLATLEHAVHTLLLALITILYSSTGMRGANLIFYEISFVCPTYWLPLGTSINRADALRTGGHSLFGFAVHWCPRPKVKSFLLLPSRW